MKRLGIITACIVVAVITLYTIPAHSLGTQSTAQVTMKNFAFQPGDITISKGGTVTWTNDDTVKHTVKFGGEESPQLNRGQTYTKTFNSAGTFDYICGIHPTMKGRVTVK